MCNIGSGVGLGGFESQVPMVKLNLVLGTDGKIADCGRGAVIQGVRERVLVGVLGVET